MFLAPSASAAVSIPPTSQCVDVFQKELKTLNLDSTQQEQQEFAKRLYQAGCLSSNKISFKKISPNSKQCLDLSKDMDKYLRSISNKPSLNRLIKNNRKLESLIKRKTQVQAKLSRKFKSLNTHKKSMRRKKIQKQWIKLEQKKTLHRQQIYTNEQKIADSVQPYSFAMVLAYLNASSSKCVSSRLDFSRSHTPFDKTVQKYKEIYWAALWIVVKTIND